jgi:hypothetical protein
MTVKGTTLAEVASGKFDDNFKAVAASFVRTGYKDVTIRLGWEFNGGWYPWAAKADPQSFVAAWRHIVEVFRATPGTNFRFVWCPAQGVVQINPDKVYPGDDVVDVIATDLYNQTWTPTITTPEQRWNELVNQPYGLKWLKGFAAAHNKPLAYPEWGTGTRPDGHGGGDDPYFIEQMVKWIRDTNPEFHGYWDYAASDYNGRLSDGHQPLAAAAYLKAFKNMPGPPRLRSPG